MCSILDILMLLKVVLFTVDAAAADTERSVMQYAYEFSGAMTAVLLPQLFD